MNRLTGKEKNGHVYQPLYTATSAAFYKLSQYEDTGLEPDEVEALKAGLPVHICPEGEWVAYTDDAGKKRQKCSICDTPVARNSQKSRFCPNCGARLLNGTASEEPEE